MLATSNSELCLMTSWFVASLPPPSGCNFHEKILFGSCWPVWFVSARLLAFRLKEKWWLTRLRSGKPTKRLPPLNDMQPAIGKGLPILVLRWPFFQRFFLGSLFRSRPKLRLQTGSSLPSRCQKSAQFPSFSSSSRSKNQSCCRCFTIFTFYVDFTCRLRRPFLCRRMRSLLAWIPHESRRSRSAAIEYISITRWRGWQSIKWRPK